MLGLLYNNGHGVPENFVQAYKWLNLAAAHASGPKKEFSYRIRDSVATKMSPGPDRQGAGAGHRMATDSRIARRGFDCRALRGPREMS